MTGKLLDITKELFEKNVGVKKIFIDLYNKDIKPIDKINQLIIALEKWVSENKIPEKLFVPEFLEKNIIYLNIQHPEILKVANYRKKQKFRIFPHFYFYCNNDKIILEIKLKNEANQYKTIQIKPLHL